MAKSEKVQLKSPGDYRDSALIVRRTLRSGQSVHYPGSVVILGDVNRC